MKNKPFRTFSDYCRETFNLRLQKIPVDAGFTCPNRDGSLSFGGCTYCNNEAFSPHYINRNNSVSDQIKAGIAFHAKRKRRADAYLIYFQAYTGTYEQAGQLKKLYSEALNYPQVAGLIIGTRPDCINEEIIGLLNQITRNKFLSVEIGVESCENKTLKRINRLHSFEQSEAAIFMLNTAGIKVSAHLILGLPGESREDMMTSIRKIAELPVDFVKFHQLQIFRGTVMEKEYFLNPSDFVHFDIKSYVSIVADMLERLPPAVVIDRFCSEVPPEYLAFSSFDNIKSRKIEHLITLELINRGSFQGKYFTDKRS